MQTLTLNSRIKLNSRSIGIPITGHGRALYTVDWFLNGTPVLRQHDNPRLTLRHGLTCC